MLQFTPPTADTTREQAVALLDRHIQQTLPLWIIYAVL